MTGGGGGARGRLGRTLLASFLLLLGTPAVADSMSVFVSILPQKFFVEQIGGERVSVSVMVGPGYSPATYAPRPAQLAALARARLYFAIGVPFEAAWMARIRAAAPELEIVQTQAGIRLRPVDTPPFQPTEDRAGRRDPHVWLSPSLVKQQARHIADALVRADPEGARSYQGGLQRFLERLDRLDAALRAVLAPVQGQAFLVFHPSWGYFADAYGLRQVPVEIDGKPPRARALARLVDWAHKQGARVLVVSPRVNRGTVRMLVREFRARSVVADPVAQDWEGELRRFASELAAALGAGDGA